MENAEVVRHRLAASWATSSSELVQGLAATLLKPACYGGIAEYCEKAAFTAEDYVEVWSACVASGHEPTMRTFIFATQGNVAALTSMWPVTPLSLDFVLLKYFVLNPALRDYFTAHPPPEGALSDLFNSDEPSRLRAFEAAKGVVCFLDSQAASPVKTADPDPLPSFPMPVRDR